MECTEQLSGICYITQLLLLVYYYIIIFFSINTNINIHAGVVLPAGPVARGHPNGRRASQSHILAGPVGQP